MLAQLASTHTYDSDARAKTSPEASAVLNDGLALHAQQECGVCACMDACLVALNDKHTVLHTCVSFPLLVMTVMHYIMHPNATSSRGAALG